MSLASADLSRIVRTIWATQLGLQLDEAEIKIIEADLSRDGTVEIEVDLSGEFNGKLKQRCSRRVSMDAAAAAFSVTGDDVSAADIRDTLIELAHMTAGNLKSMLHEYSIVEVRDDVEASLDAGAEIAGAGFKLKGEPLLVTLYRMIPGA